MEKPRRVLVNLSIETVAEVERLKDRGIDNKRYGSAPRSVSEALRRLIIIGLESKEVA